MRFESQRSGGGTARWFIPVVKCDGNVPPPPLYAKIVGRKTTTCRLRIVKRQRCGEAAPRRFPDLGPQPSALGAARCGAAPRYDGGICRIRRRSTRTSTTWFPCILLTISSPPRRVRGIHMHTRVTQGPPRAYVPGCFSQGTRVCLRPDARVCPAPARLMFVKLLNSCFEVALHRARVTWGGGGCDKKRLFPPFSLYTVHRTRWLFVTIKTSRYKRGVVNRLLWPNKKLH